MERRSRLCRRVDPGVADELDRRAFMRAAAGVAVLPGLGAAAPPDQNLTEHAVKTLGIPGPYPGRVIEVHHLRAVRSEAPNLDVVRIMVGLGIAGLTGIAEPVEAWRSMFEPGDVVGIKVNPVGHPLAISQHATVHAVVEGLESAGVRPGDIIIFDRYRDQFLRAGYEANLPEGCRWGAAVDSYDEAQLDIADYDPDVFVTLDIAHARPGVHDPRDERIRRSHLARIITRRVNKLIGIPVLKDHGAGGVTLALKNMSHGLVNNVSRSHGTHETFTCNVFIPAVVSHPVIRRKAVLQILDGLNAVFQGGPSAQKPYVWPHGSLLFATDPVALDRIGWEIVDDRRVKEGLPRVAETAINSESRHVVGYRQPQHITGAGALGLGVSDRARIEHTRIALG